MAQKTNSSWTASSVIPSLPVTDLERAVEFYTQFKFIEDWRFPDAPTDGPNGATHVGMQLGDVTMMLALCADEKARIDRQNFYVVMGGIRAYHAAIKENSEVPVSELIEADYGMLDFSITDPWGHVITFGEAL